MRSRRWCAALFMLWASASIGCDQGGSFIDPDAGAQLGCVESCPGGLVCQYGACIGDSGPPWPVALRMRPRADDPLAAVEIRSFETIGPVTELPDLPMSTRTQLVGRALLTGAGGGVPIRVRATARAQQGIDEQPLSAVGEIVERVDGPRFVLQLAPFWPTADGMRRATVYGLTLRPEDAERYPPWAVDDVRIGLGGTQIDVELPAVESLRTVQGTVRISPVNPNPIAGLRVFAVDSDGRRVSTETATDELGMFTLRLWPDGPDDVILRVRRAGDARPWPDLDRPLVLPLAEPLEINFGELSSTFDFSGLIVDENGDPVTGATVRVQGAVGEGIYSVTAGPTDGEGLFAATMYPGRFRIDIEPPADASARLVRLETVIEPNSAPRWTVPPGTTIRGTLLDPAGESLAHARLEVRLVSARYADPALVVPGEIPPARIRQAETDRSGQFAIQLDPGEHVVRVIPPPGSGLPDFDHPLTVPIGGGLAPIELRAPPAAVLVFNLRDGDGEPAVDVVVEAWRTDTDPPVRVSETLTGADGAGALRLPVTD